VDIDTSMDIHGKSVDMDMDMDGKFHIHGKPEITTLFAYARFLCAIKSLSGNHVHVTVAQKGAFNATEMK